MVISIVMKISLIIFLVMAVLSTIYNLFKYINDGYKYHIYITTHYLEKWNELTIIKYHGLYSSTRKAAKYFWSNEDLGDENIRSMKKCIKRDFVYVITSFVALFFAVGMMGYYADMFKQ